MSVKRTIVVPLRVDYWGMTNLIRWFYNSKNIDALLNLAINIRPDFNSPSLTVEDTLGIAKEELKLIGGLKENYGTLMEDDGTDERLKYYIKKDLQINANTEEEEEEEDDDDDEEFIYHLNQNDSDAWISPKGRVFCVGVYGHIDKAREFQEKGMIPKHLLVPSNWLLEHNWLSLSEDRFKNQISLRSSKATQKQINLMWDYFEMHGRKIEYNGGKYTDFKELLEDNERYQIRKEN